MKTADDLAESAQLSQKVCMPQGRMSDETSAPEPAVTGPGLRPHRVKGRDRMSSIPPFPQADHLGSTFARILLRCERRGSCFTWEGSLSSGGYGVVGVDDATYRVHRIAYEWAYGPIPDGLVIDHLCHDPRVCSGPCLHRRCVNPEHLAAVTNAENVARSAPAFKTHCDHGHRFTIENTARGSRGERYCKTCKRANARRYYGDAELSVKVRAWATSRGIPVASRGRLPKRVWDEWTAATGGHN